MAQLFTPRNGTTRVLRRLSGAMRSRQSGGNQTKGTSTSSLCRRLAALCLSLSTLVTPAYGQLSESVLIHPTKLKYRDPAERMIKVPEKLTLSDMFQPQKMNVLLPEAIMLGRMVIPGLTEHNVVTLGLNHFLVASQPDCKEMSSVYTQLRKEGKSSFITVDCLMHPYFGFTNALLGSAIENHLYQELRQLLIGMINSSIADYTKAEDEEVKDDIQRNLAYLSVGLKLLDPPIRLPDIGGASELVDHDYKLVLSEKRGRSRIFNYSHNFALFRPWGWLGSSPRLSQFHRCYQWLSRMYFPMTDITNNELTGGGNSFRRSVLLYRSLALAPHGEGSPLAVWNKIATVMTLVGVDNDSRKRTIIPPELASVLTTSSDDLARLLNTLAQPITRTKLMLSVRKQRPVELGSRSIFDMERKKQTDELVVRLFPVVQPPELPWLTDVAPNVMEVQEGPEPIPLSLLVLHSRGAGQATNLLKERATSLNVRLTKWLPKLQRAVRESGATSLGGQVVPFQNERHWQIISNLFASYATTVQPALRSELWLTHQLETSIAAWIDSYVAYNPIAKDSAPAEEQASAPSDQASTTPAGNRRGKGGRAHFHYLDPRPRVFLAMSEDCRSLMKQMDELGYLPPEYKARGDDYIKLLGRLNSIANREILGQPVSMDDFTLLENIGQILAAVDCPVGEPFFIGEGVKKVTPAALAATAPASAEQEEGGEGERERDQPALPKSGITLGTGRAGQLYILCPTTQGPMLCRGSVYTYYELPGAPPTRVHWERKLQYGLLRPPEWARRFDIEQAHQLQSIAAPE